MHLVPKYRETSPWGNGPRHIAEATGKPFVPSRPIELTESERRSVFFGQGPPSRSRPGVRLGRACVQLRYTRGAILRTCGLATVQPRA